MAGSPPDIDGLGLDDLKVLVLQLLEENAALKAEVAALREEIARLKGLKGPPRIKPSGMDQATDAKPSGRTGKRRGRGEKLSRLTIDEDRVVKVEVPAGSRFKSLPRTPIRGLRGLCGSGSCPASSCGALPAPALAHPRWPDGGGAVAGGDRRSLRA